MRSDAFQRERERDDDDGGIGEENAMEIVTRHHLAPAFLLVVGGGSSREAGMKRVRVRRTAGGSIPDLRSRCLSAPAVRLRKVTMMFLPRLPRRLRRTDLRDGNHQSFCPIILNSVEILQ
jgi:hypothetical protein